MKIRNIVARMFNAAKNESYWSGWMNTPSSIDSVVYQDREKLLAKSREQYANNDYVKRFVNLCQTNIVGDSGISVQSIVLDEAGNPDSAIRELIETKFAEFSIGVDPSGRFSRAEFESQVIQSCAIDGEAFVLIRRGRQYRHGIAFSLIDAARCPTNYNDESRFIRAGIRYSDSSLEIPVEYYFTNAPTSTSSYTTGNYTGVPAENLLHVYRIEWVGQKRGLPWVATTLDRLRTLEAYEQAALIAARVGAAKMGFFTVDGAEYTGETDDAGNTIMDAEPGSFEQLPPGMKFQAWDPQYPHEQFGHFITAHLRGVACGLGVSHHSLTGDMTGVNYTSSRTALIDERDNWKRLQGWLIGQLVRPVFEQWVSAAISVGTLNWRGSPLRRLYSEYHPASYQGRRWQWVDPAKEMNAAETAVALGVRSRGDIIREQGRDPETVWGEILREQEIVRQLTPIATQSAENGTPDEES